VPIDVAEGDVEHGDAQPRPVNRRLSWGAGALALALVGLAAFWLTRPRLPTVVFVVLDTVRADRLSLCGYARPTSPTLEALVASGARYTCDAVAPGSWTVPSHASFFTGQPVLEHGVHQYGDPALDDPGGVHRLADSQPTLAEQMAAAGYQALAVSGNPLISPSLGLTRGFERVEAPRSWRELGGAQIPELVDALLSKATLRAGGPLFLFVNLADAHVPWPAVPPGLSWVAPQRGVDWAPSVPDGDWARFHAGDMSGPEEALLLDRVGDVYDHAVHTADRHLGRVLESLEAWGWLKGGYRLVITSDHGEFLGERGRLGHGYYVDEPNQRVPLLYLEVGADGQPLPGPALPAPLNALHAYHLALDGALPEPVAAPAAVAFPSPSLYAWSRGAYGGEHHAAIWGRAEKLGWTEGAFWWVDLAADPGEAAPAALGDHPRRGEVEALAGGVEAAAARAGAMEEAALEMLRAAGYID